MSKAVIFDWDGTITDQYPIVFNDQKIIIGKWLKRPYYKSVDELRANIQEYGFTGSLQHLVPKEDWDKAILKHADELEAIHKISFPELYPDVINSINMLRESGYTLAIVSKANPDRLRIEIERSGIKFDEIAEGRGDKGPRIREMVNRHSEWREIYYFGDLISDVYACYEAFPDSCRIIPITFTRSIQPAHDLQVMSYAFDTMEEAVGRVLDGSFGTPAIPSISLGARVVIIDWAGTIIDTFDYIYGQLNFVATTLLGVPFFASAADMRTAIDEDGRGAIMKLLPTVDFETAIDVHDELWTDYLRSLARIPVRYFSDAKDTITRLRNKGFSVFIVGTAEYEAQIYSFIRKLGLIDVVSSVVIDKSQSASSVQSSSSSQSNASDARDAGDTSGSSDTSSSSGSSSTANRRDVAVDRAATLQSLAIGKCYYIGDSIDDIAACYYAYPHSRRIVPVTVSRGTGGKKELVSMSFSFPSLDSAASAIIDGRLWP